MPQLEFSRRFLKDVKKRRRAGESMEPLDVFIRITQRQWPPPAQYEPHLLTGPFAGIWDIHLRQNRLLLLRFQGGTVRFLRMGTHAELGL
ncbi:MAG: type II toxin-antitoxin system mRNA interferase toxin, RelE/StbE family [Candidatus Peregrinibacteria bacterium]